MKHEERVEGFVSAIWEWYGTHKRSLPWRDMEIENDSERAYRILVSEVMLQQTQVSRVIIVFRNFLEQFSSLQSLATASNAEVIRAWRGMGYNSRVLRLRDAARTIIDEYHGEFPKEMDQLLSIKGLGPYTAAAVRNFAFHIPTPCIDTNIRRIFHRTFVGPEEIVGEWKMSDKELLKIAEEVLMSAINNNSQFSILHSQFRRSAADWHAALMDYGSLVQTKTSPKWEQCILTERGLMKTTSNSFNANKRTNEQTKKRIEPGRLVGSTYVPNRIFRGKVVEALRDAHAGLTPDEIGKEICIDWSENLRPWLDTLIKKLVQDSLLAQKKKKYVLAE